MDLFLEAEQSPGSRVANKWWEQERLDLDGISTVDWEAERMDGGSRRTGKRRIQINTVGG